MIPCHRCCFYLSLPLISSLKSLKINFKKIKNPEYILIILNKSDLSHTIFFFFWLITLLNVHRPSCHHQNGTVFFTNTPLPISIPNPLGTGCQCPE